MIFDNVRAKQPGLFERTTNELAKVTDEGANLNIVGVTTGNLDCENPEGHINPLRDTAIETLEEGWESRVKVNIVSATPAV